VIVIGFAAAGHLWRSALLEGLCGLELDKVFAIISKGEALIQLRSLLVNILDCTNYSIVALGSKKLRLTIERVNITVENSAQRYIPIKSPFSKGVASSNNMLILFVHKAFTKGLLNY
jgi:hypothetical protein